MVAAGDLEAMGSTSKASWCTLPNELKQKILLEVIATTPLDSSTPHPCSAYMQPCEKTCIIATLIRVDTATSSCMIWVLEQASKDMEQQREFCACEARRSCNEWFRTPSGRQTWTIKRELMTECHQMRGQGRALGYTCRKVKRMEIDLARQIMRADEARSHVGWLPFEAPPHY